MKWPMSVYYIKLYDMIHSWTLCVLYDIREYRICTHTANTKRARNTLLILVRCRAVFKMKTRGVKKTPSPHLQQHMLNDIQDAACQPDCIACSHSLKTIVLGVKNHPQAIFFLPHSAEYLNHPYYLQLSAPILLRRMWLTYFFFQVSWYIFERRTPCIPSQPSPQYRM